MKAEVLEAVDRDFLRSSTSCMIRLTTPAGVELATMPVPKEPDSAAEREAVVRAGW